MINLIDIKKDFVTIGIWTEKNLYRHSYTCRNSECNKMVESVKSLKTTTTTGLCPQCRGKRQTMHVEKLKKPVVLRYYKNNHSEQFPSISDFCRSHPELGIYAKHHFCKVLNGKSLHYKGWMDGKNTQKIDIDKVYSVMQTIIKPFMQ